LTQDPLTRPPRSLVEAAFDRRPLEHPLGLYAASNVGDEFRIEDHVGVQLLEEPPSPLGGAVFVFSGVRFLLWLHGSDPSATDSPIRHLEDIGAIAYLYHPAGMNFSTTSERMEIDWEN
jgi:hypothetical protein